MKLFIPQTGDAWIDKYSSAKFILKFLEDKNNYTWNNDLSDTHHQSLLYHAIRRLGKDYIFKKGEK